MKTHALALPHRRCAVMPSHHRAFADVSAARVPNLSLACKIQTHIRGALTLHNTHIQGLTHLALPPVHGQSSVSLAHSPSDYYSNLHSGALFSRVGKHCSR